MDNLNNLRNFLHKEDYDSEPVYYCTHCKSLYILIADDQDFCEKCGNTKIAVTSLEEWQRLKKEYDNK